MYVYVHAVYALLHIITTVYLRGMTEVCFALIQAESKNLKQHICMLINIDIIDCGDMSL